MKNISTIFALAVLFFYCGSILLKIMVSDKEPEIDRSPFIAAVKEKLPIKAEQKIFNSKEHEWNRTVYSSNLYLRIRARTISVMNKYATDYLIFRKIIVHIGSYDYLLGNKILPNGVIDLGDGYLATPTLQNSIKNIDDFVQKVAYFKHILDSIGIPLVYAQYPYVICNDDAVSKMNRDFTNQAKFELMEKLSQIVPVIDLTKECRHSMFYKTDHHWQAKTSIWAGQVISKKLNELYRLDLNVELLDTNNFTQKFASKWLGSLGKQVIPLYEKENFYIYNPKCTTDINWILFPNSKLFQSSGSFDSLYHFFSDSINSLAYSTVYPDFSFSQNNNLPNGKKILLIGDSYNNSLSNFFSLVFKEVNFIYRRSSLLDDYLANKPDVVLLGFSNAPFNEDAETLIF